MLFSPVLSSRKLFLGTLIFLVLTLLSLPVAHAASERVLITPFRIYAAEDSAWLQDGVGEVLTSRLTRGSQIVVLGRDVLARLPADQRQPANASEARTLEKYVQADYVILGSLTVIGSHVSLDAQLVDMAKGLAVMSLSEQGDDTGAVIPILNSFAADMQNHILGVDATADVPAVPPLAPAPTDSDARAHPRRLAEQLAMRESGELRRPTAHNFMAEAPDRRQLRLLWRSEDLDASITGVAMGDITGNGQIETVVASGRALHLYRGTADSFNKLETLVELRRDHIVAVDVADINNNGYAEIFVSVLHVSRERASSFVLEFNGRTFDRRVSGSPLFYRVATTGGASVLYAQNQTGGAFANDIVRLHWQDNGYQSAERVLPGGGTNVLGFTVADLADAPHSLVTFSSSDYLQLLDQGGESRWRSLEPSGGNLQYALRSASDGDIEVRRYLPMRLQAMALPGSAAAGDEIIVVKNHETTGRMLAQFRHYSHAEVASYTWDGVGLAPLWRTREITGRISDFAGGDLFNDGNAILLLSVVTREGLILGTRPRSMLLAFELIVQDNS